MSTTTLDLEKFERTVAMPDDKMTSAGIVYSLAEILAYIPSPDEYRLGDGYLGRSAINAIVGPPGVGKSRLVFDLAAHQITGRPWFGLPTRGAPAKWLFVGDENSMGRIKKDFDVLLAKFTQSEREAIHAAVRFYLEPIAINTPEGFASIRAVVNKEKPDFVVLDTLASICCGPDLNKDLDMRETVQCIKELLRFAASNASALIIHHARCGSENMRQGLDNYGAGGYGRNSKVLASLCRGVLNLMPGDRQDSNQLVLACGKVNDGRRFAPIAIRWRDGIGYELNLDFDLDAFLNDLNGERSGASLTIMDVLHAVNEGKHKRGEIVTAIKDNTGASQATIDRRIKDAAKDGYIQGTPPHGNYILTDKGLKRVAGGKL